MRVLKRPVMAGSIFCRSTSAYYRGCGAVALRKCLAAAAKVLEQPDPDRAGQAIIALPLLIDRLYEPGDGHVLVLGRFFQSGPERLLE